LTNQTPALPNKKRLKPTLRQKPNPYPIRRIKPSPSFPRSRKIVDAGISAPSAPHPHLGKEAQKAQTSQADDSAHKQNYESFLR
jgi:hypothetical protein